MSKTDRIRNCNSIIELICMANTKRSKDFYIEQLGRHAKRLSEMKNDHLG